VHAGEPAIGREPPRALNDQEDLFSDKSHGKSISRVQIRVQTPVWLIYVQLG